MMYRSTMIAALLVITLLLVSHAIAQVCVTPPTGMVSWWPGDGDASDIQGGHDGTFNGAFAQGKVGLAFDLAGSSNFVQVPDSAAWHFGLNNFTIDLWVNFNQVNDRRPFVAHDEGASPSRNRWVFWLNNGLEFHISNPGSAETVFLNVPFSPTTNTWYHVAVTRSGSTYTFYINGAAAGSLSDTLPVPDASANLTLGWAVGDELDGLLDEVEIFNRALSAAEIQAIYAADSAGKCKSSDTDGDSVSDDDDNCPDVANPGQEDVDDDGLGDACDTKTTFCSNLGDDRPPSLLDQDIYVFEGTAQEQVTVTVAANPDGEHTGNYATLAVTGGTKRKPLLKIDSTALPNTIKATLPVTGTYQILFTELPKIGRKLPFLGDYCLTLESLGNARNTLDTTRWVE